MFSCVEMMCGDHRMNGVLSESDSDKNTGEPNKVYKVYVLARKNAV